MRITPNFVILNFHNFRDFCDNRSSPVPYNGKFQKIFNIILNIFQIIWNLRIVYVCFAATNFQIYFSKFKNDHLKVTWYMALSAAVREFHVISVYLQIIKIWSYI